MASYIDTRMLADLVGAKNINSLNISEGDRAEDPVFLQIEDRSIRAVGEFLALCDRLEVEPASLIKNTEQEVDTCTRIILILRADDSLDTVAHQVLVAMIEWVYRTSKRF